MKILSKIILVCVLVFPICFSAAGQDSSKYWTFSYDIFKALIDEQSITMGHKVSKHHYASISLGYTYYNSSLRNTFKTWSPDQGEYPIFVYSGPTFRGNYDFFLFRDPINFPVYVGIDLYFKHLFYNNYQFYNESGGYSPGLGDDGFYPGYNSFIRSETANVYGAHIHLGIMSPIGRHLYVNFLAGFGRTYKYRLYTTTNSISMYYNKIVQPDGTFTEDQQYWSPILSIGFGFRI